MKPRGTVIKGFAVAALLCAAGTVGADVELTFRFNDAVIRNLIVKRQEADTSTSKIYEEELREQEKERERDRRRDEEVRARVARRQEERDDDAGRDAVAAPKEAAEVE